MEVLVAINENYNRKVLGSYNFKEMPRRGETVILVEIQYKVAFVGHDLDRNEVYIVLDLDQCGR